MIIKNNSVDNSADNWDEKTPVYDKTSFIIRSIFRNGEPDITMNLNKNSKDMSIKEKLYAHLWCGVDINDLI